MTEQNQLENNLTLNAMRYDELKAKALKMEKLETMLKEKPEILRVINKMLELDDEVEMLTEQIAILENTLNKIHQNPKAYKKFETASKIAGKSLQKVNQLGAEQ